MLSLVLGVGLVVVTRDSSSTMGPTPGPTTTTTSAIATPTGLDAALAGLLVAPPIQGTYNRDDWPTWVDADGDCQNTRAEVLIAESLDPVSLSADGCRVVTGRWVDLYTGATYTDASQLDIDHLVPLADAYRSGGLFFTAEQRRAFANDIEHPEALVAVSASANRSKGDQSPDQWTPAEASNWCAYATGWVAVKVRWQLSVTQPEHDALAAMLATC